LALSLRGRLFKPPHFRYPSANDQKHNKNARLEHGNTAVRFEKLG
jgi:hypothetical protein